jgi:hypothetical protein
LLVRAALLSFSLIGALALRLDALDALDLEGMEKTCEIEEVKVGQYCNWLRDGGQKKQTKKQLNYVM